MFILCVTSRYSHFNVLFSKPCQRQYELLPSEEKICKNWPIRNNNCLWWPCLLMDRDEMSNLYRGPSIDTSYQISDQLALRFQRRLKCEKLTDDKWWLLNMSIISSEIILQDETRSSFRRSRDSKDSSSIYSTDSTSGKLSVL
jgi:hypothetical protein